VPGTFYIPVDNSYIKKRGIRWLSPGVPPHKYLGKKKPRSYAGLEHRAINGSVL